MSRTHNLTRGKAAFLDYYSHQLPHLSSPELEAFLTLSHPPVLLFSPHHADHLRHLWHSHHLTWQPLSWYPFALHWPREVSPGTPLPGYKDGWLYSLNPASLLPVLAGQPDPSDSILDACAAPGGKTLALANLATPSHILANDASLPRFKRLRTALRLFGYPDIETRNFPAQTLSRLNLAFDLILLDAPCSSEKHVFNSKPELRHWSPKRISVLAHQQLHLLDTLLPLLTPTGRLVYSTCALIPAENEAVVAKALSSHPEFTLSPLPLTLPLISPGLPDHGLSPEQLSCVLRINANSLGFDPMFVAVFSRQH